MLPSRKRLLNINIQNFGIFDRTSFSLQIQKAYKSLYQKYCLKTEGEGLLATTTKLYLILSPFFFFECLRSIQYWSIVKHFSFINVVYPQEIKISDSLRTQINLAILETPVLLSFSLFCEFLSKFQIENTISINFLSYTS